MIVFGPVPSRRLGQSLGINNIPPKTCSYSCVYCQIGRTTNMRINRSEFYEPFEIYLQVQSKVNQLQENGKQLDYISFVPDGEPTLDKNLGTELDLIKNLNISTAVITNASPLWMDEVKKDLAKADWVSVKIDAVWDDVWHRIDRPHGGLSLKNILDSMIAFSKSYKGHLVTETMLVSGFNDDLRHIEGIAEQISKINPRKSYLLVPTRPPAEKDISRVTGEKLIQVAGIINSISGVDVECITTDDTEQGFFFTNNIVEDLLNITSVHPIREEIIKHYFKLVKADSSILQELIEQNKIIKCTYRGKTFYKKNLKAFSDKKDSS
jgi:wyosine [tRNA(Phe)-imidazoG37] synthetase (radical SAM superfamily)